jgi:hypothetical protein
MTLLKTSNPAYHQAGFFYRSLQIIVLIIFLLPCGIQSQTRDSLAKNPALFLKLASKTLGWTEPAEPGRIAGPIYFVGTKGLSSFLITTDQGHILLYTGMPGSGPMIAASIKKLGFKPEDIKYIITGHAHCDHSGGHAYIKKISGAQVALNTLYKLEMLSPDIWLSCHTDFFDYENKRKLAVSNGINAWIYPEGYRLRIAEERVKFEEEINTEKGVPKKIQ